MSGEHGIDIHMMVTRLPAPKMLFFSEPGWFNVIRSE
jgi:hypothetical protein